MRQGGSAWSTATQSVSYFLGGGMILFAVALALWSVDPEEAIDWTLGILGPGFVSILAALILGALYCLLRLIQSGRLAVEAEFWFGAGLQLANGVATVALTYTLFGISVGIGALAGQGLTPDTVEGVIRDLTASFSLAFMTTVVGLPLSATLRGLLVVVHGRQRVRAGTANSLLTSRE